MKEELEGEVEQLQENALRIGALLLENLQSLAERYSVIGDVRGCGLFIGIEFVRDLIRDKMETKEINSVTARLLFYVLKEVEENRKLIKKEAEKA